MSLAQYIGWRNYLAISDLGFTPNAYGDNTNGMGLYAQTSTGTFRDFTRKTLDEVRSYAQAPVVETGGVDTVFVQPIVIGPASPSVGVTYAARITAWRVTPSSGMGVTNGPFLCEKIAKWRLSSTYAGTWPSGTMADDAFSPLYTKPSIVTGDSINTGIAAAGTAIANTIDWKLTYAANVAGLVSTASSYWTSSGISGVPTSMAITGLTGASHIFFGIDMENEASATAPQRITLLYRLVGEY